jgi:hydrogenase/urease accessory protein HupE
MLFLTHGIIAVLFATTFSYEKKAWGDAVVASLFSFLICGAIGQLADSMELPLVWLNILLSITITGIFIENRKRRNICTVVGIIGFIAYVFTYLV